MPYVKIHTGRPSSACTCERDITRNDRVVGRERVGLRWIHQNVLPYDQRHVQIIVTLRCPVCKTVSRVDWIEPMIEQEVVPE